MSKKFTTAQQNYAVHELETLAILEALMKWEDKLIEYDIRIITDHKTLEFFKTQITLTVQQRRWMDYMSRFTFDITYIKGELNKVADCLSRYYKNDTIHDVHMYNEYIQADAHIDLAGEDLPALRFKKMTDRVIEIQAMCEDKCQHSTCLHEWKEQRDMEAEKMVQAKRQELPPNPDTRAAVPEEHGESDMTLADMIYDCPNNAKPG